MMTHYYHILLLQVGLIASLSTMPGGSCLILLVLGERTYLVPSMDGVWLTKKNATLAASWWLLE